MLTDADAEDHYNPSVRLLEIARHESGSCGFHLTRSKWDPYPWVSGVDSGSAAHNAGLKTGDCVVEVNGEDIIGQRISEVAQLVRRNSQVSLLLWNVGIDTQCSPETLCCGPMPTNLQRLTACMSSILTFLECPICLDTISPPTYQCDNGHLICMRCRAKSERCPVCRTRFARGRSLLADQIYNVITGAFGLKEEPSDVCTAKMQQIFKLRNKNKNIPGIKVTQAHTNKLLARLVGKASSVDNLSTNKSVTALSLDNEFNTNLKAKSLSSTEIFVNPIVSRTGSVNRINRTNTQSNANYLDAGNRPASYHGSYESLTSKLNDDISLNGNLFQAQCDEEINFYCPFESKCTTTIKGIHITDHFQKLHNGPLVQYFKPRIKLNLENIFRVRDTCYLINHEGVILVLKVITEELPDGQSSNFRDIHLWMWCMGDKRKSNEYHMIMKLFDEDKESPMLSIQCAIYSLSTTTWKDIDESKKGIFLSGSTMEAICKTSSNLTVDIFISKSDISNN